MDTTTSSATRQKALALNLDARAYGTFAEIGAGQEVARWFFAVVVSPLVSVMRVVAEIQSRPTSSKVAVPSTVVTLVSRGLTS